MSFLRWSAVYQTFLREREVVFLPGVCRVRTIGLCTRLVLRVSFNHHGHVRPGLVPRLNGHRHLWVDPDRVNSMHRRRG